MYSIIRRAALRRAVFAPVSRTAVVAKRYTSTEHGNDPEVLDLEKQRNLRKEQHKTSTPIKNAPGWNQTLATASEAAVKADRSDEPAEELTTETIEYVKSRFNDASASSEERVDAYEASYERDETTGPLGSASAKETVEREKRKESHKTKGV